LKRKRIEKVKEFKYLEYTLQRNGDQEAHVKDRVRKMTTTMDQVWGIGKNRFGRNCGRKM